MRKILIVASLVLINFAFGQFEKVNNDENAFSHSEQSSSQEPEPSVEGTDPGGPGDPVPINQHLPLLALTGTVLIIGVHYLRKRAEK